MKTISTIIVLLLSATLYSQNNPDYKQLAKACELWGNIKLFDPSRPGHEFDSAFAAAVPGMMNAKTDNEWISALSVWLNSPAEPYNRFVPNTKFGEGYFRSEINSDSILIITISGSRLLNDYFAARHFIDSMNKIAVKAKGIIFDLRQPSDIPTSLRGIINSLFEGSGLNEIAPSNCIIQYKTMYYSGYKPETGISSGGYTIDYLLHNANEAVHTKVNTQKFVWLVNRYSELPFLALAQQISGNALIISDEKNIESLLPLQSYFPFSENVSVSFKSGEILRPGNKIIIADYIYSNSDQALKIANDLINKFKSALKSEQIKESKYSVPDLTNYSEYPAENYPSLGYRILAAAKIYMVIDNFFPYKQYLDHNWEEVLFSSLPDFAQAKDENEYQKAVAKMYANISDSHGFMEGNNFQTKLYGEAPSPVYADYIDNKVIVTRLRNGLICKKLGIRAGDIILKVNGIPIEDLMKNFFDYFSTSTKQSTLENAAHLCIRGPEGSTGIFTIQDESGKTRDLPLSWTEKNNINFKFENKPDTMVLLPGNIGYADLTRLIPDQTDAMFEMFRNTKAIIFDMRGYPHGTAWTIAPRLTDKKNTPLALFRRLDVRSPNIQTGDVLSSSSYTEFIQTLTYTEKWKYKGKTVMLINENAISQAEHTGLFFKAVNNTTFIGSNTAGANGDVTNFTIPGKMILNFSGQGVWYPDGRQLQRKGLQPDVYIRPTLKGIDDGKDEVLDKAIEWINQNIGLSK